MWGVGGGEGRVQGRCRSIFLGVWLFSFSSMSWFYIDIQVTKGGDKKFGIMVYVSEVADVIKGFGHN